MTHRSAWLKAGAITMAALAGSPALAIEKIPSAAGWSGYVIPGVGYIDIKSNTLVGNKAIDIGQKTISSINAKPGSESDFHPIASGEVRYTLAGGQTQFFLGSSIEDLVTLDLSQSLGARRNIGSAGVVELGLLFSGVPPQVWEDPYVEGEPRVDTDRDSRGLRVRWDKIFGSDFEFEAAYRNVEVGTERSGEFLGLDDADRALLRRDADFMRLGLVWRHKLSDKTIISPEFRYLMNDADGDAESYDGYVLQLAWAYIAQPVTLVANVGYTSKSFDEENPIYGRKRDSDTGFLSGTLLYQLPTASKRWSLVGIVTYAEEDSDINFHDNSVWSVIGGAQYRFGQ